MGVVEPLEHIYKPPHHQKLKPTPVFYQLQPNKWVYRAMASWQHKAKRKWAQGGRQHPFRGFMGTAKSASHSSPSSQAKSRIGGWASIFPEEGVSGKEERQSIAVVTKHRDEHQPLGTDWSRDFMLKRRTFDSKRVSCALFFPAWRHWSNTTKVPSEPTNTIPIPKTPMSLWSQASPSHLFQSVSRPYPPLYSVLTGSSLPVTLHTRKLGWGCPSE